MRREQIRALIRKRMGLPPYSEKVKDPCTHPFTRKTGRVNVLTKESEFYCYVCGERYWRKT